MEIQIILKNPDQLAQLIHFWHTSKITPSFKKDDRFYSFLYQAIDGHSLISDCVTKETVLEDVWVLHDTFQKNYLDQKDPEDQEQWETIVNFLGIVFNEPSRFILNRSPQKPTEHFKEFCGSEWLNPDGRISQRCVLDFFDQQCKIRKIRTENGQIFLNDWAKKLFQTNAETIPRAAILDYITPLLHSL